MIVEPKVRGFICTTAHPKGCAAHVQAQIQYVKEQKIASKDKAQDPRKVLVIGASTGYGLASRIVSAFGYGAATLGVLFEKPAGGKRTASAGWYNTAAFEEEAKKAGLYAKSINGDAFSLDVKQQVIDQIQADGLGNVDLVIYSLAAPRRVDAIKNTTYNSVLKPIGKSYQDKTLNVMTGEVSEINIDPATDEEIGQTIRVMGGDDWFDWIQALLDAKVLARSAVTVAYSYIGPEMTYPIYRHGTIGKAKEHLESTAFDLQRILNQHGEGRAYVSVNKGLVTQASAAIPVVPLYISLLYAVMKKKNLHEGCIEQITRLFTQRLYTGKKVPIDEAGRIRIDDWEMQADVQKEVAALWQDVNTENLEKISDIAGYREAFYQLFGFHFPTVDYGQAVEVAVPIPSIPELSTESEA